MNACSISLFYQVDFICTVNFMYSPRVRNLNIPNTTWLLGLDAFISFFSGLIGRSKDGLKDRFFPDLIVTGKGPGDCADGVVLSSSSPEPTSLPLRENETPEIRLNFFTSVPLSWSPAAMTTLENAISRLISPRGSSIAELCNNRMSEDLGVVSLDFFKNTG
ncbi:hypothetical protein H6P81_016826 [Aristolochia fimbriata]|uniref:Uncharacterized protein n=1 Tax=Aristolochia fimbriata TaxID=158543 RepID=A0AAV7ECI6_ARIFI|nr:hypothetical protein H6P81_016826 [Aristolochia fimbriata]